MDAPLFISCPRSIANLTYPEIEEHIRRGAALLVPLCTTEPYGNAAVLGCCDIVGRAVARCAADRTSSLCAPPLAYGCGSGLRAFPGTVAVKPRTLASLITQTLHGWYLQGLRHLWVIDGGWNNAAPVRDALERVLRFDGLRGGVFSWVRDSRVRSYWAHIGGCSDGGRAEHAILSMAAFLTPSSVRPHAGAAGSESSERLWPRWRRRGQDPELFRALFPSAFVSSTPPAPDRARGERLFTHVVDTIVGDLERG